MADQLEISPVLCRILHQRGMTTLDEMQFFLSPGLRYLKPLESWPHLQQAADIIASSVNSHDEIAVWGDYDVDGITSTALLKEFFRSRGIEITSYLPHRIHDGYGLNTAGIEKLAAQGVRTLITVDCGISHHAEIARAKELGIRVILTDHHQPGQELPPADAVLNPRCSPCPYPELAGVGSAFFLAAALNKTLPGPQMDIRDLLDLVALGTIADLVPLDRANRILVKNGLLLLSEARRPGIYALKEASGLGGADIIGAGQVGFGLGPRINAAGRLDDPHLALELLLSRDLQQARTIAKKLNTLNNERKKTEDIILEKARDQAQMYKNDSGLVLFDPEWHSGVLGIVASRLVDEFYLPCLVLTRENGIIKGSGRSISGFNLYQGLCSLKSHLSGFGGHSQAAGLSMQPENLDSLRSGFNNVIKDCLGPGPYHRAMVMDARLGLDELSPDFLQELELLQPFGPENPRPVFQSPPLKVVEQSLFGNDKHVRFHLKDTDSGMQLQGQFWRQGHNLNHMSFKGKLLTLAYTPGINIYQGLVSIRLNIKEILEVS
ncbi:single-stranded-DNA-specific exonuclease RecJ [Desulfonatronospira sp.]|uniref:single-stranded-DNA-specific exonuclease RecJ n=1 Tax=Desulfonatronospira sp. TaxID=1962951 RepID=UPI0025C26B9D|nr:single-stranded-DNA-specific exonuclease RecJ [Desulfonatronospira sp.]